MPEQVTRRGVPITDASLVAPFETPSVRFGAKGVNLKVAADVLEPDMYRRFTNAIHFADGKVTARPGLVNLTGHSDDIHSIRRLNIPETHTWTRVWGVGTAVGIGQSTITEVDSSGYTGDPLSLLPYRPPLASDAYMFVADTNKVRKVRHDGLVLPIGLPAPGLACTSAVAAQEKTTICEFDTSDASDGAQWTKNGGFDFTPPPGTPNPTEIPLANDFPSFVGSGVEFVGNPSTTNAVFQQAHGWYTFWGLPRTLNLAVVGSQVASDDDLIHLYAMFSHPELTAEFRVYLVCGATFDPSVLPGTSFSGANADFYVKTWRQNDFSLFIQTKTSQIDAAEVARVRAVRDTDLKNRAINDDRGSWETRRAERDPARTISQQTGAGREEWVEFGVVGTPVRRGDFQRVGSTAGRDWSTITGIVIYLSTVDGTGGEVSVSLDNLFLGGGYGPDTSEPGDQQYDYRITHYDPRTGAEGNPSPEQTDTARVDALRQQITVTPAAPYGDSAIRQRFYRRGGSLIADWYFLGSNTADGGAFVDQLTDDAVKDAGTVELDNDAFVTSIDDSGNPIYQQPLPILFGPCQDLLFALGDPHRPGDVYYCKPGQPDSWPAANHTEVTSPSEPLMNGGIFAGQAFCFSTERGYVLYPSLTEAATAVTAAPTECKKGLLGRWGMAIGHGRIWFVAKDGVYSTTGGQAEYLSDDIRPIFHDQTVEGYAPIDKTQTRFIKLCVHDTDLILLYKGQDSNYYEWRYSILYQYWRPITRGGGLGLQAAYSDEIDLDGGTGDLIYGGWTAEFAYTEGGTSDDGVAIAVDIKTADSDFGRPREDKRLGDLYFDLDRGNNVDVSIVPLLNHDAVTDATEVVNLGTGRQRYILSPFGATPQEARSMGLEITWSSDTTPPVLYQWGAAIRREPDVTMARVTQWEDLGSPSEVYLTGVTLDVDTKGGPKQFYVEYDDANIGDTWSTIGPFTITHDERHKASFSWPAVKAKLVRIRPVDDCSQWQLYRTDWIFDGEPPRIAGWDINFENGWDQYVTGVDLECNTFAQDKTVHLSIDGTEVALSPYTVNTNGRKVFHLTVQPPVRGHVLRFWADDANDGLLYSHRWHTDPEPSEQTNWNQNYSTWGYDTDKWLKALVFQCDTFAQDKSVTVEIDGIVVETLTVNASGRSVVELALSSEQRGRVFRFLPTDTNPGRIYNITPVFDLEPLALTRWETQEVTAGIDGWKAALYADLCLRAPLDVTLTVTAYNQSGDSTIQTYTVAGTANGKIQRFVPFVGSVGVLYKFLLTSAQPFWLYREESRVCFVPWGSDKRSEVPILGDDDLDPSRGMGNAQLAAATPGGEAR